MEISTVKDIKNKINLTKNEKNWKEINSLPILISEHYFSLIENEENDPLRKQVIPSYFENIDEKECDDPQNEKRYSIKPYLVHRYKNRVAFLVTDICYTYCRHCFRQRHTGKFKGHVKESEIDFVVNYLEENKNIKEILLTGGDSLTLSDEAIINIINKIRSKREDIIIRICTRVPCVNPDRISNTFLDKLDKVKGSKPFFLVQFNHPRELNTKSLGAINRIREHKYLIFNQTVLLKDINDNVDILVELMNKLLFNQVYPYYLFQADLVINTSHFRVPLSKGLKIYKQLRKELSGLALPTYAVDLPHGGGKIPVDSMYYKGEIKEKVHQFENLDGHIYEYIDAN